MSYEVEPVRDIHVSPRPATSETSRVIGDDDEKTRGLRHYKDSTNFGRRSEKATQE